MPRLVLIRGKDGAGKTTLAEMVYVPQGFVHYEEDHFFYNRGGGRRYAYDPALRSLASKWCRDHVFKALSAGRDVVVSNFFNCRRTVEPYRALARALKADLQIITLTTQFESLHITNKALLEQRNASFQKEV
jgi:predicted kinase